MCYFYLTEQPSAKFLPFVTANKFDSGKVNVETAFRRGNYISLIFGKIQQQISGLRIRCTPGWTIRLFDLMVKVHPRTPL